jgi:ribose transport system substrate-binding protein
MPEKKGLYFLISLLLSLSSLCLLSHCSMGSKQGPQHLIALVIRPSFNTYLEEMEKGVRDEAQKRGMKVLSLAHDRDDEEMNLDLFNNRFASKVDAFIFVSEAEPLSTKNLVPMVAKANTMNIPVVFMHGGLTERQVQEGKIRFESCIECDRKAGALKVADYLGKALGGRGKIMLIEGYNYEISGNIRREGFLGGIRKYPRMEVIYSPPGNWRRADATFAAQKVFKEHPDIDAVVAWSDDMAIGASDAVKLARVKKPIIIGFDGTKGGIAAIEEGRIDGTVAQYPYETGRATVEILAKILKGEKVSKHLYVNSELLTKEKLQQPFQYNLRDN